MSIGSQEGYNKQPRYQSSGSQSLRGMITIADASWDGKVSTALGYAYSNSGKSCYDAIHVFIAMPEISEFNSRNLQEFVTVHNPLFDMRNRCAAELVPALLIDHQILNSGLSEMNLRPDSNLNRQPAKQGILVEFPNERTTGFTGSDIKIISMFAKHHEVLKEGRIYDSEVMSRILGFGRHINHFIKHFAPGLADIETVTKSRGVQKIQMIAELLCQRANFSLTGYARNNNIPLIYQNQALYEGLDQIRWIQEMQNPSNPLKHLQSGRWFYDTHAYDQIGRNNEIVQAIAPFTHPLANIAALINCYNLRLYLDNNSNINANIQRSHSLNYIVPSPEFLANIPIE